MLKRAVQGGGPPSFYLFEGAGEQLQNGCDTYCEATVEVDHPRGALQLFCGLGGVLYDYHVGTGYLSVVVIVLRRRLLPQGRHKPSFLGSMCRVDVQAEFDLLMISALPTPTE